MAAPARRYDSSCSSLCHVQPERAETHDCSWSPLHQLGATGHLRSYCHTPPQALPLRLARARVPAVTLPHIIIASTTQRTRTRRQLPPPHRSGAPLAPCTGLALLRSLRTHSDAAAIALPNPAARTQLSFLSWTFVLCPSLAGTFFFFFFAARLATPARAHAFRGASCHTSTHARAARARTTPSDERYDVRSAGVADWKTAARGNTERTLTA